MTQYTQVELDTITPTDELYDNLADTFDESFTVMGADLVFNANTSESSFSGLISYSLPPIRPVTLLALLNDEQTYNILGKLLMDKIISEATSKIQWGE